MSLPVFVGQLSQKPRRPGSQVEFLQRQLQELRMRQEQGDEQSWCGVLWYQLLFWEGRFLPVVDENNSWTLLLPCRLR